MDNFGKHISVFKILGIYIDDGSVGWIGQAIIRSQILVGMFLMGFQYIISLILGILWLSKDYEMRENLIVLCSIVFGIVTVLKYIMFLRKRKVLAKLTNHLKGFRPSTTIGKYTRWFTYLYEGMAVYYNISVVLMAVTTNPDLSLPFPIWYPIEINTPLRRVVSFLMVHIAIAYAWTCMVLTDTLLLHLSNQLCDRLWTLNGTLRLIGLPEDEKDSERAKNRILILDNYKDNELIQSCLAEHILLLKLRKDLGDMLNETFLYQVINSMSVLMVVFYVFTNSDTLVEDSAGFAGVLVVEMVQVLTSCLSGELLKSRSEAIHFAVYNSRWYDCDPKLKTSLLIMATYSTHEVDLKGSYVFNLSLATYETGGKLYLTLPNQRELCKLNVSFIKSKTLSMPIYCNLQDIPSVRQLTSSGWRFEKIRGRTQTTKTIFLFVRQAFSMFTVMYQFI